MISKFFKRIENAEQLVENAKIPYQTEQILQQTYRQMKNAASTRTNERSG